MQRPGAQPRVGDRAVAGASGLRRHGQWLRWTAVEGGGQSGLLDAAARHTAWERRRLGVGDLLVAHCWVGGRKQRQSQVLCMRKTC